MTTEPTTPKTNATNHRPNVTRAKATTSAASTADRHTGPSAADVVIVDTAPVRPERIDIRQGGMDVANADTINLREGGISVATANAIDVRQGGIGRASATDIAVASGGIGLARGERVSVEMGALGAALGGDSRVVQSTAGLVISRETIVDQSFVGTLVGARVTIRQPSAVLILIAGRVDGTVRPLLDWRGALVAGAAAGLVMSVLRRGRR